MSVAEVGSRLSLSPQTLRNWIDHNTIREMLDEDFLIYSCGIVSLGVFRPVARPGIGNGDVFFDFFAIRYRVFALGYLGKHIAGDSSRLVKGDVAKIAKFWSAFFAGLGAKVEVKGFSVLEGPEIQPGNLVVPKGFSRYGRADL